MERTLKEKTLYAINNLVAKGTHPNINNRIGRMVDETDPENVYVGYSYDGASLSDPSWMINKISKSNSITSIRWCDNVTWVDRASAYYK